jgi:hypothetical protein
MEREVADTAVRVTTPHSRFFLSETKNNTTPIPARIMAIVKPVHEISAR